MLLAKYKVINIDCIILAYIQQGCTYKIWHQRLVADFVNDFAYLGLNVILKDTFHVVFGKLENMAYQNTLWVEYMVALLVDII